MEQNINFTAIEDTFALLCDWEDRYAYLIEIGQKLPVYPETARDDAHKVPGCISQVWMDYAWEGGKLNLYLDSDAHLVKGLLAVLFALYHGCTPSEIIARPAEPVFASLGLESAISPNRRNGFFSVATKIQTVAREQV